MVSGNDLLKIKTLFNGYVSSFYTGREQHDAAIRIKEVHTRNVALEILDIAGTLGMDAEERSTAETTAVLHDIGRFEQFARYHTYSDAKSEDHAALGVRVTKDRGVLEALDPSDRDLVLFTTLNHNKAALPEKGGDRQLFFLRLLRDADKIDILNVVTAEYSKGSTSEVLKIGLPDTAGISDRIVRSLAGGRLARAEDMQTFNDFKLLQMSWVFDLNFPRTFEIVRQRKYLEKIRDALPDNPAAEQAFAAARDHLNGNCP
jgi:hypothetical protein